MPPSVQAILRDHFDVYAQARRLPPPSRLSRNDGVDDRFELRRAGCGLRGGERTATCNQRQRQRNDGAECQPPAGEFVHRFILRFDRLLPIRQRRKFTS